MNASSTSPSPPLLNGDNIESDSDTNSDQEPDQYQPISATDVGDSDEYDSENGSSNYETLDNGHCSNDVSSLRMNDEESDDKSGDEEEEEEEEEERMREEIARAFREDERRRLAPLTEENARRVMEGMRGISFGGLPPDWAARINDEEWVGRLRALRQPPNASPTSALHNHF